MAGLAVVVIVNGSLIASVPPAHLTFGHVVAPLRPVVTAFADRISIAGDGEIVITAGTRRCTLRIGSANATCDARPLALEVPPFERDGEAFVPLADLARALGGSIAFDSRAKTIALRFAPRTGLESPAPFDPRAPQIAPTRVFTPEPAPPTPRPLESGSPRPRRTAIPETPSRTPAD